MGLSRRQDRHSSDAHLAEKDIEYWMSTICDNIDLVPAEKVAFVERCEKVLEDDRVLLEWEISDIEHLYENVCARALGHEPIKKHSDKKPKGLRY